MEFPGGTGCTAGHSRPKVGLARADEARGASGTDRSRSAPSPLARDDGACLRDVQQPLAILLENDVRPVLTPLIRGEERTLSLDEQRLLAAWAAKTALMLDLVASAPIVPAGFYCELRQLRTALPSQAIWLAAYLGNRKAIWAEHRGLHITEDEPPNAFITTFSVFRVVFQVVGHFTKGGATFDDTRLLSLGLARIWPACENPIDWPRERLAFGDDALAELAASINGYRARPTARRLS
jgi:hypothetical protein